MVSLAATMVSVFLTHLAIATLLKRQVFGTGIYVSHALLVGLALTAM